MSRSSAVAMLLIESAKASFLLTREHRLLEREWDSVCGDPSIQSMVIHNTLPSSGLFKRITQPKPTASDFEKIRLEFRSRLKTFERFDEIKACFHGYEAEFLLYGELCGIVSEGIEEIAWERLGTELEELNL